MSWFLDRTNEDKPELEGAIPSGLDQFIGSIESSYFAQDSHNRRESYRIDLEKEMVDALGGWDQVRPQDPNQVAQGALGLPQVDADYLGGLIADARIYNPGKFANLPTNRDEFEQEVKRRYTRDQEENDASLARGSSSVSKFAGSLFGAATDEYSLPLLFLGGGGSVARVMAMETLLGAAGEVPAVIKQNDVRTWQGKDPVTPGEAVAQVAIGGVAGGLFGGAVAGISHMLPKITGKTGAARKGVIRGVEYFRERVRGEGANRPAELNGGEYSQGIDAAEQALRTGQMPPVGKDAPQNWAQIRNGIFAGESGGDYNALFGFSNREGGPFADVKLTEMTVDQAIAFSDPNGKYAQWVKQKIGRVATPMGAYQIVGKTLRAAKKGLGLKGDELMTPDLQERLGQYIFRTQGAEAWAGYRGPRDSFTPTDGGSYQGVASTGDGFFDPRVGGESGPRGTSDFPSEISTPAGTRVPVEWKIVDMADLKAASGDLQPRDRSRAASDAQIGEIAARLDPQRLMPSRESDRGAPIVGPDMVVESGNGRVAGLRQAMGQNPEAYAAYVDQIKGVADVPKGVKNPVLVGVRKGDLAPADRVKFVRESNMSSIARMAPTEQAKFDAGFLDQRAFDAYVPGAKFNAPENAPFARRMLSLIPAEERSAFLAADGTLNRDGIRRVREALFARAFEADDLIKMFAETESKQVESLIGMLEQIAPDWAYFRAAVEAGHIRPEFDITPQLMETVRVIAKARSGARAGQSVIAAIRDKLAQGDMFATRDDLSEALIDAFYKGERARAPSATEEILRRYAAEAAQVGRADIGDLLGEPVTPHDALRAAVDGYDGKSPFEPMAGREASSEPLSGPVEPLQDISAVDPARYADGAQSAAAERVDARLADELTAGDVAGPDGSFRLSADTSGPEFTMRDVLDDLDADQRLIQRMSFCSTGGGA
ncbi:hypothetical protein BMG03_01090 [Thioclava nitratireducens]|uniref:DdrB-like domain-containing protein n=1 Tax=Thioclava nitratireducens TaxID=1915078 RepID=A0ABN4X260_9RHOB|nr:hypothetical protein [Thioclava nitratireducens]AQS46551.1 hypothetical protein BMG03_01090 [Thioclava nitratireducens]